MGFAINCTHSLIQIQLDDPVYLPHHPGVSMASPQCGLLQFFKVLYGSSAWAWAIPRPKRTPI